MAFSPFSSLNGAGGQAASSAAGPDLETIQTEALGFNSIGGDTNVRLTNPWPTLPPPTASLLSIAADKGIVAAAGPEQVILAPTDSVRKLVDQKNNGESTVKDFEAPLSIPMSVRVSHLAFTSDEKYLVLSAEAGGGLAVYDTQALLQGSKQPAFERPTNGESLRCLVPNPSVAKADLVAVVTSNGNLHMANLAEHKISNPIKTQVSCVSWSAMGKQMSVGLADGSISQLTPEGEVKAEIPAPPNTTNCHVSSVIWLENHVWLAIYTNTSQSPPSSVYSLITREPPASFTYQKLLDPVDPFGSDKVPHHTLLRLRNFPPNLTDLLVVSSTASTDLGLLTRSKAPLATDKPADSITNVFTVAELLDDSRRPTIPMHDSMDLTPIGVCLDLSSREKVYRPIPSDEEVEESATPLPGLWVLTDQGVLCFWWIIYNDSVKQGEGYPGLAAVTKPATTQPAQPASKSGAFGQPSSSSGPFGSSNAPAPTSVSASAFGSASQMGQKQSVWGSLGSSTQPANTTGGAAFGQSSFANSTAATAPAFGKPSFGQSSQLGLRSSPWSNPSTSQPAFGQSGFASFANNTNKPFAGDSSQVKPSNASGSGGFASFASQGGFSSVNANNNNSSIFGSSKPSGPFGGASDTIFPSPKPTQASGQTTSGLGSTPFQLGTTFRAEPSANEKPSQGSTGSSMFGSNFGLSLNETQKSGNAPDANNDEDMTISDVTEEPSGAATQTLGVSRESQVSTTPQSSPTPPTKFTSTMSPAPGTSLFGQPTKLKEAPSDGKDDTISSSNSLSFLLAPSPAPARASPSVPTMKSKDNEPQTPTIKVEEDSMPMPPDATSKATYSIGGSSSSSNADAPNQKSAATPLQSRENRPFQETSTTPGPASDSAQTPKPSIFSKPGAFGAASTNTEKSQGLFGSTNTNSTKSQGLFGSAGTGAAKPQGLFGSASTNNAKPQGTFGAASTNTAKPQGSRDAPLPPNPWARPKQAEAAPLPPNPFMKKPVNQATSDPASLAASKTAPQDISSASEIESDANDTSPGISDDDDDASEGSGVDVAKDLSPSASGMTATPGLTPHSSFGGIGGAIPATSRLDTGKTRNLFGEVGKNAPKFPQPNATSPRSPSPVRSAIPPRMMRPDATRSVSAPGMASQLLGSQKGQNYRGAPIVGSEEPFPREDTFMTQQRKLREKKDAEESQPLVDQEDDSVQQFLASKLEGTLVLDEFIAHSNVEAPAEESVPAQVEAVYRDINAMVDSLGLNARALKAFVKGHTDGRKPEGRMTEDLENPDDWVLIEVDELSNVLDCDMAPLLEENQVHDIDEKLAAIHELARDTHRLRAKQDDLKKAIYAKLDPEQARTARSLPLSAEQAAQQNELRREVANLSKLLAEAEEALTLFKAKMASLSGSSGRGNTNVPTVDAVIRTIGRLTAMIEKRSGDVDVLETQLRRVRLDSIEREESPAVTPQGRRSVLFSPESTPSRNLRHSIVSNTSQGGLPRSSTPRKKLSGFSEFEKQRLMDKRGRRHAVLSKLQENIEKKGVNVWRMEDNLE